MGLFQHLKCEDLLLSSVFYILNLTSFDFRWLDKRNNYEAITLGSGKL